jgi:ankyrin repeat protein
MMQKIIDGRTDLVFEFINQGGDANANDLNGISLMKWCAYYGDLSALKFLSSHGASLNNLGENYDLNGAAFHGHWKLCQFLLAQGSKPNFQLNPSGETALNNCIKPNNAVSNYLVELLLYHGADPNIKTNPGHETGSFMRNTYTKGETALHRAAAFGNEKTIKLLLDAGADKRIRDINHETPIGWASWHCRPGKILALLAHDEHTIHSLHEERLLSDHGFGWSGGMELNLLGKMHF